MGRGIHAIHINIRSLRYKIDQLRAWLSYNNPNVITLSETWLDEKDADSNIKLENYTLYRSDRGSRGGGVATYISSNLNSQIITPRIKPELFEGIFIKLHFHENKQLIIGNIYRPPSSPLLESVKNIIATITSLGDPKETILLGDFNLNWLDPNTTTERNLFNDLNLTQIIKDPTRITNKTETLIDCIFVTHPNRVIQSGVLPDCFSDHCVVFCFWKIFTPHFPPKHIRIRNMKLFNSDLYINDLQKVNWYRLNLIPDVDLAWEFFYAELLQVIDKHAPWRTIRVKGYHLPWISGDLIRLFKKRDRAFAKFKHTKQINDWEEYKQLRNMCTTQTRNAKANYYRDSLANDLHNPKQFWKRMNSLIGKTKCTSNSILINNEITHDPGVISNAFSLHFSQTPNVEPSLLLSDISLPSCNSSFTFKVVGSADVLQAMSQLSSSSGPGPDGIESKFLKIASHVLSSPLSVLFNMSFTTCKVPQAWKSSKIIPLHKSGDTQNLNNYRPISIINSTVKIFEKMIFNQLSDYLQQNNLLSQCQSGFRKNFSTTSALLKITNDITHGFDNNMCTRAIFLDLTKAFDLVDHYILLDKLQAIGLSSSSLCWFNSYLHQRRQCVSYRGCQSNFNGISKGIPQGSALGPLLFSIFINDLPLSCTTCKIHLYADDAIIYCTKKDISEIDNCLQSNFNSVQQWMALNKLLLNKTKSYSMLFQRRNWSTWGTNLSLYFLDSSPLEPTDIIKYLGVWLENDLSFKIHIQSSTNRLNYHLRTLYQSINCFTYQVRQRIAIQLLLPTLDYADVVYMNATASCLHSLDVVYHRICRFVLCCPYRTHHCVLYEKISWLSPSARRHYHWLLYIFKCIYFNYPLYLKQYLVPYCTPYSLRNADHAYFMVPHANNDYGKSAFCIKAPQDWNNLPLHIRSLTSYPVFQNALLSHLRNICSCF